MRRITQMNVLLWVLLGMVVNIGFAAEIKRPEIIVKF